MKVDPFPPATKLSRSNIAEVKYSLPAMLEELKAERAASVFAMEKLGQVEIGKLFEAKGARASAQ